MLKKYIIFGFMNAVTALSRGLSHAEGHICSLNVRRDVNNASEQN
jgi:hypothetical protein